MTPEPTGSVDPAGELSLCGADFPVLVSATSRWADNDMFGHLNNAVYYQLFDTAINGWLLAHTGADALTAPYIAVVAESGCRFYREVGFPQPISVGLEVVRLGRSSVTYRLGIFNAEADKVSTTAVAAVGDWVHVYLDRASRRPSEIPAQVRSILQTALGKPLPR